MLVFATSMHGLRPFLLKTGAPQRILRSELLECMVNMITHVVNKNGRIQRGYVELYRLQVAKKC